MGERRSVYWEFHVKTTYPTATASAVNDVPVEARVEGFRRLAYDRGYRMSKSVLSHFDRCNLGSTTTRIVTLVSSAEQQSLLRCLSAPPQRALTQICLPCASRIHVDATMAPRRTRGGALKSSCRSFARTWQRLWFQGARPSRI